MFCAYCGDPKHSITQCPEAKAMLARAGTILVQTEAVTADDAEAERAMRFFQLRAWARGMWTDAQRAGFQFSPETLALQPSTDTFE